MKKPLPSEPLSSDEEAFLLARNKYLGTLERMKTDHGFDATENDKLMSTDKSILLTTDAYITIKERDNSATPAAALQEFQSAREDYIKKGSDLLENSPMNNLNELGTNLETTREITTEQGNNFEAALDAARTGSPTGAIAPSPPPAPGATGTTAASTSVPPPPPAPGTTGAAGTTAASTSVPPPPPAPGTTGAAGATTGTTAAASSTPTPAPAARALTAAQKTAREYAQTAKASYEGALQKSTTNLPNELSSMLQENNTKFRQLPHGNNKTALDEMDAAENKNLGSLDDVQKTSLKQVQQSRREYMSASIASSRTAARHDHIAGISPFQLADKKKSVLSERSQGIIKGYFDGLADWNPFKKAVMAMRSASASKEAAAAQQFLADMEAKRTPTVDDARAAAGGFSAAAATADPTTAALLDGATKTLDAAVKADDAIARADTEVAGGAPARTTEEQKEEQAQDLYADLQKSDNKEIIYNTQSGQHRITFDKASGTLSSKNPEALAKFVASTGDPSFKITHGSGEAGLNLLHHLVDEGVQDVSMTPEMRGKIKSAGGEDVIRIADARSETFRNTSAVEQGERSLNALTFTRMTSPEDASARKNFNKEYCTNDDRKDMLGILKEKLEKGQITQEQFAQEAKSVLSPVNEATKSELTAGLSPELRSAIEAPTPTPTSAPAVTAAAATTASATSTVSTAADSTAASPTAHVAAAATPAPTTSTVSTAADSTASSAAHVAAAPEPSAPAGTPRPTRSVPPTPSSTSAPKPAPRAESVTATTAPTPTTSVSARVAERVLPTWTKIGMGEARSALTGANSTDNKSEHLASKINTTFNRENQHPIVLQKYLEGVKNFLKSGENNTKTNFIDTVVALAIKNPAIVPAILPNLEPKELSDFNKKIGSHENTDKAEEVLSKMEEKDDKTDESPFEEWEDHHPIGKENKEKNSTNPDEQKQQDKTEVKQAEQDLADAKDTVEQNQQQPEQQKGHEEEQHRTSSHGKWLIKKGVKSKIATFFGKEGSNLRLDPFPFFPFLQNHT